MTRKTLENLNCNIANTLDVIGDKWSIMIIRDAFFGVHSFSGYQKGLGIARNILSERLSHLVDKEILEKRRTRPGVERFTYHLTEKGKSLFPLIVTLVQWGDQWVTGPDQAPVTLTDKKTGEAIQNVGINGSDGRVLNLNEVSAVPGPGANSITRSFLEKLAVKRNKIG